jgi:hypothetical protein
MFIVMKYLIKLENLKNGDEAIIQASAHSCVETLSPQIKMVLNLPYVDHACHRFVARGVNYVVKEHMISEQEIIWENDRNPGCYRCSEKISIERIFTTIGSSIKYYQDTWYVGTYDIRCTLLKRVS